MRNFMWAGWFGMALLVGCGGGGGGGGGGSAPTMPVIPPSLTALIVNPPASTVDVGDTVQFGAVGQFSDGSIKAVAVTWSASNASGSVDAGGLATALAGGDVTITASAVSDPAIQGSGVLTVQEPRLYVHDWDAGILRYDLSGGVGTPLSLSGDAINWSELHGMYAAPGALWAVTLTTLYHVDLVTSAVSIRATLPGPGIAVGRDSLGRVLVATGVDLDETLVHRWDPATGLFALLATVPLYGNCIRLDAADNLYLSDGGVAAGASWIQRVAPDGTVSVGITPRAAYCGGIVFDDEGRLYAIDMLLNELYRYEDLNADGDFNDAGEQTLIPWSSTWGYLFGLGWNGQGVLINDDTGMIHLVRDLDGDGDMDGAGETSTWGPHAENGSNFSPFQVATP